MNKLFIILILPLYILVGILFLQKFTINKQKTTSLICSKEDILNLKVKTLTYFVEHIDLPDEILSNKCLPENIKKANQRRIEYKRKSDEISAKVENQDPKNYDDNLGYKLSKQLEKTDSDFKKTKSKYSGSELPSALTEYYDSIYSFLLN